MVKWAESKEHITVAVALTFVLCVMLVTSPTFPFYMIT